MTLNELATMVHQMLSQSVEVSYDDRVTAINSAYYTLCRGKFPGPDKRVIQLRFHEE